MVLELKQNDVEGRPRFDGRNLIGSTGRDWLPELF
jgi:hypothetical protein